MSRPRSTAAKTKEGKPGAAPASPKEPRGKKRSRPPPGGAEATPPPPASALPAHAALTTEEQAKLLRSQLAQAEAEALGLAAEQAAICSELLTLARETISKTVHQDIAKAATGALKAALGNVQARQSQTAMQVRQIRADLARYEATELVTFSPDVSPHTQTLDDILKGRIPASTADRIAAARVVAGQTIAKTEDDPAAALVAWTGTVWSPPASVPGEAP